MGKILPIILILLGDCRAYRGVFGNKDADYHCGGIGRPIHCVRCEDVTRYC